MVVIHRTTGNLTIQRLGENPVSLFVSSFFTRLNRDLQTRNIYKEVEMLFLRRCNYEQ